MNDDMERRLRELFEDKATESAAASRAPEPVVKRARRRQLGTIAVSVVTVIALAGVSFAGIRTLNGTGEQSLMPADISPYDSGRYPVFERTAQIESLSVTSPSDWYLVNQWPLGVQIANQIAYSCTPTLGPSPVGCQRFLRCERFLWPQWLGWELPLPVVAVPRGRDQCVPDTPTLEPRPRPDHAGLRPRRDTADDDDG